MEKGPKKGLKTECFNVNSKQIGTVEDLLKLTDGIEIDPHRTVTFYAETRQGMLRSAKKDFMTIVEINDFLKELSPVAELPENLFLRISQRA
jgi:hypothetical protein